MRRRDIGGDTQVYQGGTAVGSARNLSVAVTRTINLGNYESVKLFAGLIEDVPVDKDIDREYNRMFDICLAQIQHQEQLFTK